MKRDRNFYTVQLARVMGAVILTLLLMAFAQVAYCQTITQDANGNFVAVTKQKEKVQDKKTGQTYKHTDGKTYEVYKGSRGGLYVWRTRQSGKNVGKKYKYYLKVD